MTNEELKEKIVDILVNCKSKECVVEYCATCEGNPSIEHCREKEQADALIAAGLRFGENITATFDHMALEREHQLERRLGEATKAMYVYERALYYATLKGETADEVKYNDALKRAQKDFAENKGD